MKWWLCGSAAVGIVLGGCSGSSNSALSGVPHVANELTQEAQPTEPPRTGEPLRKRYARGETVDIANGTLFLDPMTGGGEAWADVRSSPSGMFVAWNGSDGKQPPVLFETDTYRRIELETGGAFGRVLDYSPDDTEVAVLVGEEVGIASTDTGAVRLRFPLASGAIFPSAAWGPHGRVAVQSSKPDRSTFGLVAWADGVMKSFPTAPNHWGRWSPVGKLLLASAEDWLALIDLDAGTIKRIEGSHPNPRWSESGLYFAAQLRSGEVMVYRADGTPHMRLGGVCAEVDNPWIGDEIGTWGYGRDVQIGMDGSLKPYTPAFHSRPFPHLRPDGSVALLDRLNGSTVLAELKPWPGVAITGTMGEPWTTTDGRGRLALGGGAKGGCENVRPFKVEMASLAK